jgi:hypothetical protein
MQKCVPENWILTQSTNLPNFIFCWPCISMQLWVMTNLMHSFLMYLFMPLHVSSSKCSSSGGPNFINTSSGVTHSGEWQSDLSVKRKLLLTGTSDSHSPECVIPDDVLIQFGPPDDEHLLLETCRGINKYIKRECIKLVITQKFTEIYAIRILFF